MQARRIAVIEDEASIAASVAARLRAEGFEVEVAEDGLAGVDLCRRFRPDLVVLDRRERALQARASPLGHGVAESVREESNLCARVEARCSVR
jgi:CheY-like chemotaxis protein